MSGSKNFCLVVIDAQVGFRRVSYWGEPANPHVQQNIKLLVDLFAKFAAPVVVVKHNSQNPLSPLHPASVGNDLEPFLIGAATLEISKTVNSAFYGSPSLLDWLNLNQIVDVYICGITTNFCCETTARMAGNLGFRVRFVLDATTAFDGTDLDGNVITGLEIMRHTAANLQGEFADVISVNDALAQITGEHAS